MVIPGKLKLDVTKITNPTASDQFAELVADGGSGKATLTIAEIESEDGDPKTLLGPSFTSPAGEKLWEEQAQLLESLFGYSRNVSEDVSFEELQSAIEQVRVESVKLLNDKKKWQAAGRRLTLAVQIPVVREVVWVEVQSWDGKSGKSILLSDPTNVDLQSGTTFAFGADIIMDYRLADAERIIESGGIDELVKNLKQ